MTQRFFSISLSYATFGCIIEGDTIIEIAPIAKWAIGKNWEYCRNYWLRKGGIIEEIKEGEIK